MPAQRGIKQWTMSRGRRERLAGCIMERYFTCLRDERGLGAVRKGRSRYLVLAE